MSIFEQASRKKLRFSTEKGNATTEDLWDLPLTVLDSLYKSLNKEFKATQEESLLQVKSPVDKVVELKMEIVKSIVQTRLEELKAYENAEERKAQKQKILEIMARKQDAELEGKSLKDLEKLLAKL